MKADSYYAVLIGDVVGSRRDPDQRGLLKTIRETLDWTNARLDAAQPLRPTIGDEFQGAYRRLDEALEASLLVALKLKGHHDVRFGIAWGLIEPFELATAPAGQSGAAWWAARKAIQDIDDRTKGWPAGLRTRFSSASDQQNGAGRTLEGLLSAFLICRDQIVSRMDDKDARIALGLFAGQKQEEMALELGIGQSTISARQRTKGPSALYQAHQQLSQAMTTWP